MSKFTKDRAIMGYSPALEKSKELMKSIGYGKKNQKGGSWGMLAATLAPVAIDVVSKLIKGKGAKAPKSILIKGRGKDPAPKGFNSDTYASAPSFGYGKKQPKQLSAWNQHLSAYRKANPQLSLKEAMKGASKTYRK